MWFQLIGVHLILKALLTSPALKASWPIMAAESGNAWTPEPPRPHAQFWKAVYNTRSQSPLKKSANKISPAFGFVLKRSDALLHIPGVHDDRDLERNRKPEQRRATTKIEQLMRCCRNLPLAQVASRKLEPSAYVDAVPQFGPYSLYPTPDIRSRNRKGPLRGTGAL